MKINIKPLSVNECWRGKRYKTPAYLNYEKHLLYRLKPIKLPEPPFEVFYEFGLSSKNSDWDNPIKPFQDILQKKFGFNDKEIQVAHVKKTLVKKGDEYVFFDIKQFIDIDDPDIINW